MPSEATATTDWAANVPLYSPDGKIHAIPQDQVQDAIKDGGGKRAIPMLAPDGKHHWIHEDEVKDATANGGRIDFPGKTLPKWAGFTPGNMLSNAWQGVKGTVAGAYDLGKDVVNNPNWVEGPSSTLQTKIIAPMNEEVVKAGKVLNEGGSKLEAGGHILAGSVPLIGPWAASLGEQAGRGDIGGAVSQVGGVALGGKALGKIHEKVGGAVGTVDGTRDFVRNRMQGIAGAGEEPIFGEIRNREGKVQERAKNLAKSLAEHDAKIKQMSEAHAQKIEAVKKTHANDVATREKEVASIEAKHADEVAKVREDWVKKTYESRKMSQEAAKVEGRREALQSAQKGYAKIIDENVKQTHKNVRSSLDTRWKDLRATIGEDATLNSEAIKSAVDTAREKFLMGTPADLKVFNDLVNQMTGEGSIDAAGGAQSVLRPLSWGEGQTHYSAFGDKLYGGGDLPGNVKNALRYVRDGVLPGEDPKAVTPNEASLAGQLGKVAQEKGAGGVYRNLKRDWSQYMQDWHDTSSQATGGSTLAKLYRAKDAGVVARIALSEDFGPRLMETFARYGKSGASPALLDKLRGMSVAEQGLPKVRVPKAPGKLEAAAPPKLPKPVPDLELPTQKPLPKAPTAEPVPQVNPFEIRLKKLESLAAHGGEARGIGKFNVMRILERQILKGFGFSKLAPKIREWVASQARPIDPDYVPKDARVPAANEAQLLKDAKEEFSKLNTVGNIVTADYLRGTITREGYLQRLRTVFPQMTLPEAEEIASFVDKRKVAVK